MSAATLRQLQGQTIQLTEKLNLTWKSCPFIWSQIPEAAWEKLLHAHPICADGVIETGYTADRCVCDHCHGAGQVLVDKTT